MHRLFYVATFLALCGSLAPAKADIAEDCTQEKDRKLSISACTAVIASGDWTGENLAWAYFNRGSAHNQLRDYELSVADNTKAISLKPDYAKAFNNRANAYRKLGNYPAALADLNEAIRLGFTKYQVYMIRGFISAALGDTVSADADWDYGFRLGGVDVIRAYQSWMKHHGHYAGASDGLDGPGTRAALRACARNPDC